MYMLSLYTYFTIACINKNKMLFSFQITSFMNLKKKKIETILIHASFEYTLKVTDAKHPIMISVLTFLV